MEHHQGFQFDKFTKDSEGKITMKISGFTNTHIERELILKDNIRSLKISNVIIGYVYDHGYYKFLFKFFLKVEVKGKIIKSISAGGSERVTEKFVIEFDDPQDELTIIFKILPIRELYELPLYVAMDVTRG